MSPKTLPRLTRDAAGTAAAAATHAAVSAAALMVVSAAVALTLGAAAPSPAAAQAPAPAPAAAPAAPPPTTPPGVQEVPASKELLKSLRGGGYVLYMRHATTDTSKPDAVPKVDLADCATQRNLNDEGRKQAAAIGRQIRAGGIPVGEVIHSPFCRTRETAQLAFPAPGPKLREEVGISYPSNLTAQEKLPVLEATRKILSAPVPAGTNRVVVGHAQNLAELMDLFVKPEGAMVVLRPQPGGRFEYLASITPAAWAGLLK